MLLISTYRKRKQGTFFLPCHISTKICVACQNYKTALFKPSNSCEMNEYIYFIDHKNTL